MNLFLFIYINSALFVLKRLLVNVDMENIRKIFDNSVRWDAAASWLHKREVFTKQNGCLISIANWSMEWKLITRTSQKITNPVCTKNTKIADKFEKLDPRYRHMNLAGPWYEHQKKNTSDQIQIVYLSIKMNYDDRLSNAWSKSTYFVKSQYGCISYGRFQLQNNIKII